METCRTCARCDFENGNNWSLTDLFHPTRWQSEMAQIHLEFVNWKIKISPNDGLPHKICSDCFTKFCSIFTFRLACQDAQLRLCTIFDKIEEETLDDNELDLTEVGLSESNVQVIELQPLTIETVSVDEIYTDMQLPTSATIDEIDEREEENLIQETTDTDILQSNCDELLHSISYACQYCYKSIENFQSQESLLEHIEKTHDQHQPYNCPECDASFQDAASRTVHIKNEHVEKHYACTVCGKKYSDRFNLRHHVEKYHTETDFECNMCEKRFFTRKSLNYHMKWHNPEHQIKCSQCDRLFINQRHLKRHEATHNIQDVGRRSEYCGFCGKAFIHLKTLRWHIYRQHGGEKPYKCGNCTEVFASYAEKRLHMLAKHMENLTAIERSECMICRERYATEQDLRQHMEVIHIQAKSDKPLISNNKRVLQKKKEKQYSGVFQCDVCSQRFNMKSALERHAAVHSTEGRPHACQQCSKRFKRAQDMKWHMKTHSNEKPNICDVCGKGFALKYVLTQHKRSHEVLEKNFKCSTCGRAYLFEKSLRLHERVHTGKTYYKCDLCGERFVTHIKFKCHMQKMHHDGNGKVSTL